MTYKRDLRPMEVKKMKESIPQWGKKRENYKAGNLLSSNIEMVKLNLVELFMLLQSRIQPIY